MWIPSVGNHGAAGGGGGGGSQNVGILVTSVKSCDYMKTMVYSYNITTG